MESKTTSSLLFSNSYLHLDTLQSITLSLTYTHTLTHTPLKVDRIINQKAAVKAPQSQTIPQPQ